MLGLWLGAILPTTPKYKLPGRKFFNAVKDFVYDSFKKRECE
jgi:hypothetical protein